MPLPLTFTAANQIVGDVYDADGSLVSDTSGESWVWNGENQLAAYQVTGTTQSAQYIYDGLGRRVEKIADGVTTLYLRTALGPVADEVTGSTWTDSIHVPGAERVAPVRDLARGPANDSPGTADTVTWLHADQVGTTRVLTDQNGNNLVQCNQNSYYAQGSLLTYAPFGAELDCTQSQTEYKFTGKPRDEESGLDDFGARYHASTLGRFLSPDPAGVGFSSISDPQSWNLYSYAENNPVIFIDPDGHERVWDDGSFDSKDDLQTGSYSGCAEKGGTWFDPGTFAAGNGQDWSASPNATLAAMVAEDEALRDSLPSIPDPSSASYGSSSSSGMTTTINLWGSNWQSTQISIGTHPWRDNNPDDIISGPFTAGNGQLGIDGRFAVFPDLRTGRQALDTLLNGPGYDNLTINAAVAKYAPSFENNTAGYQQFLINVLNVSGNTPLSSLSSSQMQILEDAISQQEGFNARGNYSVTTTSVMTPR